MFWGIYWFANAEGINLKRIEFNRKYLKFKEEEGPSFYIYKVAGVALSFAGLLILTGAIHFQW